MRGNGFHALAEDIGTGRSPFCVSVLSQLKNMSLPVLAAPELENINSCRKNFETHAKTEEWQTLRKRLIVVIGMNQSFG